MALFVKQDFTPPILSRKWIAVKCRPNMLLQSRTHVISILESGLLFREDSTSIEQLMPASDVLWQAAGGGYSGWLTKGERWLSAALVAAAIAAFPPKMSVSSRGACLRLATYAGCVVAVRTCHRQLCKGQSLAQLLAIMREYTALARRAMACVKEYTLLHGALVSVSSLLESALVLLYRQQVSLALLMSRGSSALLGNLPWLQEDVNWDCITHFNQEKEGVAEGDLVKVHHAFLVIQSAFLKHVALAHFIPPLHSRKLYSNHNERIYWLHTQLINHLYLEFQENYEALDRMYRLLKNYGSNDTFNTVKKSGLNLNSGLKSWLYSDVHCQIVKAAIDLKVAMQNCTNLDVFLDSCSTSNKELDVNNLNKDIDGLSDKISECLKTVETAQKKLKKLQAKFNPKAVEFREETENTLSDVEDDILKIEDKDPETKDEVFFFVKTEEDGCKADISSDIMTVPGQKEKDATKVVLKELKKKLVKREDAMRAREKVALENSMPELKDNLPEFPRQIVLELEICLHGFINKIRITKLKKLFKIYKIHSFRNYNKNDFQRKFSKNLRQAAYVNLQDVESQVFVSDFELNLIPNSGLKINKKIHLTIKPTERNLAIYKLRKTVLLEEKNIFDSSDLSEGLSDVESSSINKTINDTYNRNKFHNITEKNEAKNFRYSKRDLELSPSTSDSDYDFHKEKNQLLKDVRKHRVARKKNVPVNRRNSVKNPGASVRNPDNSDKLSDDLQDEGLRPVEYSFGTGMALASMLHAKNGLPMAREEVFIGDGEVSSDSGNDEAS